MASLKNLLEGRPFRSPLHPALVHLPLGLLPLAVLLDSASWIWPGPHLYLVPAALYCLIGGIFTALLAAAVGFVDFNEIPRDHPARKTAVLHMVLNLVAVVLFSVSAVFQCHDLTMDRVAPLPFLLSIAALAALSYSGYLGGHLVYGEGTAVGRHRRKTHFPVETIALGPAASAGMIAVAEAGALPELGSLRVNAGGTIVAIARVEGRVYAFQEFCTHRYGPLSEGSFKNCEVTCPWHRSRFDLRTGKVTAGPAKIDLPVYRVEERDGKIWMEVNPRDANQRM